MKPLFTRPIFTRPIFTISLFTNIATTNPRTCFQIAHFSTNFQNQGQSSYPSRRHEEESRNVKVSVWWDFENCAPPAGVNVFKIAQSITAAIRANGIKGPINITAFGDVLQLSRMNQEALSSTGINLTHIPNGGKNSADRSLLVDLMYWVSQNPPPAHLLLISGDRDFAGILHRLRMNNYNILLASPGSAPSVLCSAASIMWQWNALLKGENFIGKHFNQPPDGPYGSWYGHYKAPLDDPFAVTEQPTNLRSEEVSEAVSEQKCRPIPRSIVRQIRNILNSYPKGVPITELRAELAKSNLNIDKDLYGYKKFSRFLLAMPNILKLQFLSDGNYLVRTVNPKVPEQGDNSGISVGPETNGEAEFASNSILNGETGSCMEGKNENPLLPQSSEKKVKTSLRKLQGPQKAQEACTEVHQPPPENVVAKASEGQLQTAEQHGSAPEMGFLKRLWNRWFGNKETASGEIIINVNSETAEKDVELKSRSEGSPSFASGNNISSKDLSSMHSEDTTEKCSQESNLLKTIKNWCRSWRSSNLLDETGLESHNEFKKTELCAEAEELFSKESFWRDLGSFLISRHGSVSVLLSRTRAKMAQNLQQEGPSFMNSLSEGDALLLVDLLISDKKWVDECLSRTFPYKLNQPAIKASMNSTSSSFDGLSSVFSNTSDTSNLQSSQKLDGERRHQNPPHTGVSRPVIQGSSSLGKSRNEVLTDCQKLVDEIVKQYPEGFNMKSFRSLFRERYGYFLDVNKLGYTKLINLLQIMPGIKIESNYIVPSVKVPKSPDLKTDEPSDQESDLSGTETNLDSESSSLPGKDNEFDSRWEELGPVSKASPSKNEIKLGSDGEAKDESSEPSHGSYEAPLDRDFSDSDDDTSSSTKQDNEKSKMKEEDSSLLQILDSWYGTKDGLENVDGIVESSTDGSKLDTLASVDQMENYPSKRRQKTYSFVTDQPVDTKDKLIDGILGSLKKSGEKSPETRV